MTATTGFRSLVGPRVDAPAPRRRRRPSSLAVGFCDRLSVLLGSGGLLGSSAYDDGVYYAAAAASVHGRWPYADFVLLYPPAVETRARRGSRSGVSETFG